MNARFLLPSARKDARPAWAIVQVTMPSTAARPHETDLLLCGHHYRAWIGARPPAGA